MRVRLLFGDCACVCGTGPSAGEPGDLFAQDAGRRGRGGGSGGKTWWMARTLFACGARRCPAGGVTLPDEGGSARTSCRGTVMVKGTAGASRPWPHVGPVQGVGGRTGQSLPGVQ